MTSQLFKDFPRLPYFLAVAVPASIVGAWTTAVVSNKFVKDYFEEISPAAIDLVRQHVGFDEEDLEYENYVKKTLEMQSKEYKVTVKFADKTQIRIPKVSGLETMASLQPKFEKKIAFIDIEYDQVEGIDNESNSAEEYVEENRFIYIASLTDSLWNCANYLSKLSQQPNITSTKPKNPEPRKFVPFNRSLPFSNNSIMDYKVKYCLQYFVGGINNYLATGNRNFVYNSKVPFQQLVANYNEMKRLRESQSNDLDSKEAARERIAELEDMLKKLNTELRIGNNRSFDAVQQDMQLVEQEIANIKRTKINNFYYF